ncbi:phospholipid/cholesterol/gamma-HCH transport system substrate-binding protein [Polymorphobacter multimanifer]|uniref:Phospholipid/cholesterol/gamma-HCH transport system substrate-binding protein n=2 Tax=Polymorphobacter multimanifer TaxID=1070431 RepID=A0A841LCZ0_9SPHN|nr:MlaD family protein [Polymorphobacter multimanifer]MBB6227685.1 phospholipid/cholesterol/gamma-HCH transport system substrate-binding protein [Polymorphobacter multimanifer]
METRSNYAIVGGVVLLLVVALFAAILWFARFSGEPDQKFDILFNQAVTGLAPGSPVAFNGVPVGKIDEIKLQPRSPEFVRVRISVQEDVPILEGTTATIEGVGFTGVSQIQLTGSMAGGRPLTTPGPYGVPIISARAGGLGALLASAPELLKNVSLVAKRLAEVLDEDNKDSISNILRNVDRLSDALADRGPEIAATLTEARATLAAATTAMARVEALAGSTDAFLREDAKPLAAELGKTLRSASVSLERIEGLTASAEPGLRQLTTETIPEASQLIRELRALTAELNVLATRLDEDPIGAVSGGNRLPSYDPAGSAQK